MMLPALLAKFRALLVPPGQAKGSTDNFAVPHSRTFHKSIGWVWRILYGGSFSKSSASLYGSRSLPVQRLDANLSTNFMMLLSCFEDKSG